MTLEHLEQLLGCAPRLVMFDLDGTLVDSLPDIARAVDAALATVGRPAAGLAAIRTWVGNGSPGLLVRALHNRAIPTAELESARARLEPGLFERAYQAFLDAYGAAPADASRPYPGVKECLQGLQTAGVALACVTNKPGQFVAPVLEGVGLAHFFALTIAGDSLPRKKPAPDPLLHCLAHFDVPAGAAVMVGDSDNDVLAARAAGVKVVAVSYGYNYGCAVADAGPDWLLDSLGPVG